MQVPYFGTRLLTATATLLCATTGVTSLAQLFAPSSQPYIVAQSDYGAENGNMGGVTSGYPFVQTFTATHGGTLYSLAAGFYAPETGMHPYYTFQLRDTVPGGLPSAQVLASVVVPTTPLSTPAYAWIDLTADFSGFGIGLVAGHQYGFSIDAAGPLGTTTYNNFFWGMTGGGYAGGEAYGFTPSGLVLLSPTEDFLFTVQAVPEPSAIKLALGLALGAWACRARFHRHRWFRTLNL